jgi:Tol biopolymer transport system component
MEFFLLNLQTAQSSNLSKLVYKRESLLSKVHFRAWSPDGKKLAIVVSSTFSRPGRMWYESDLLSVDPVSLQSTYVATIRKEDSWQQGQFVWDSKAGSFDLAVDPSLRNSAAIIVKTPPPSRPAAKSSN